MKMITWLVGVGVSLAIPALFQSSGQLAAADAGVIESAPMVADTGRINVSATATVQVPADRVQLRFAIETRERTAALSSQANAELANAVVAALRTLMADADHLETSGYRVDPTYGDDGERGRAVTGYRTSNAVLVTLADLDATGLVLDAALGAGANRVDGVTFFASDMSEARDQAIREAALLARRQAETTADALGVQLGHILQVSTNANRPGGMRLEMAAMDMRAATPIEAGSDSVTATVSLTIAIHPESR